MAELIVQPTVKDNYLYKETPDANCGTETSFIIYAEPSAIAHPALQFDFSELPEGAVISAATLNLYYFSLYGPTAGRTYWAYELTQTDWTETGSTWNKYDGSNAWSTAGGDYIPDDGASLLVPLSYGWMAWDVLNLVKHFQSSHSKIANFLLRDGTENATAASYFYSRNYNTNPTLRPKLIITYELGGVSNPFVSFKAGQASD